MQTQITQLESELSQFKQYYKKLSAENIVLTQTNEDVESTKKSMLKDMHRNEIMNEKETYKLNAKLKEYKYIIHEQKKTIQELDLEMQSLKSALELKEQLKG